MAGMVEILTAVLVVVTAYYAWQTFQMVGEMRASREVAVLPKLAIELATIGPNAVDVALMNVGPGPALDVDVSLRFEPRDGVELEAFDVRWKASVMASGDQQQFAAARTDDEASYMQWDELSAAFAAIRLTGECTDALGNVRAAEDIIDLGQLKRLVEGGEAAMALWRHPDPERRLAKALSDDLAKMKPLKEISKELKALRRTVQALNAPRASEDQRDAPTGPWIRPDALERDDFGADNGPGH